MCTFCEAQAYAVNCSLLKSRPSLWLGLPPNEIFCQNEISPKRNFVETKGRNEMAKEKFISPKFQRNFAKTKQFFRRNEMDIQQGHAAWTCRFTFQRHAARTSRMDMRHGHTGWTSNKDMQNGHAAGNTACACSMDMQRRHVA